MDVRQAFSVRYGRKLTFAAGIGNACFILILPFALNGQHLNVGQVLVGAIQAGNGVFVSGPRPSLQARSESCANRLES